MLVAVVAMFFWYANLKASVSVVEDVVVVVVMVSKVLQMRSLACQTLVVVVVC